MGKNRVLALCAGLLLLAGAGPVWAHSFDVTTSFSCLGSGCSQESEHEDQSPWKGWANLTVTNTGTEPWGDFHFQLFQVDGNPPVLNNVFFQINDNYAPQSSQTLSDVVLSGDGLVLDIEFYGDWVYPTEILNISVYTNNAGNLNFFGTLYYPTPIPEPGTAALLGLSLLGLLAAARRAARR